MYNRIEEAPWKKTAALVPGVGNVFSLEGDDYDGVPSRSQFDVPPRLERDGVPTGEPGGFPAGAAPGTWVPSADLLAVEMDDIQRSRRREPVREQVVIHGGLPRGGKSQADVGPRRESRRSSQQGHNSSEETGETKASKEAEYGDRVSVAGTKIYRRLGSNLDIASQTKICQIVFEPWEE